MTIAWAHRLIAGRLDPIVVFQARCEVRAYLYGECELDLHEAVDVLQDDAVKNGLVGSIGQDAVQAMMAAAFGPIQARIEHAEALARAYALQHNADYVYCEPPHCGVATSTIGALRYVASLNDPARLRTWLAKRPSQELATLKLLMVPT